MDSLLVGDGDFDKPIKENGFITSMLFLFSKLLASWTGLCELGLKNDGSRNWSAFDLGEPSLEFKVISFLNPFEVDPNKTD